MINFHLSEYSDQRYFLSHAHFHVHLFSTTPLPSVQCQAFGGLTGHRPAEGSWNRMWGEERPVNGTVMKAEHKRDVSKAEKLTVPLFCEVLWGLPNTFESKNVLGMLLKVLQDLLLFSFLSLAYWPRRIPLKSLNSDAALPLDLRSCGSHAWTVLTLSGPTAAHVSSGSRRTVLL